jgi:hypothetical protein
VAATGAAKVRRLGNFSDDGSRKDPVLDHETFYLILLSANSSAGPVEFMSQEAGRLLQNGFLIFLYIERQSSACCAGKFTLLYARRAARLTAGVISRSTRHPPK